MLFNSIDFLFFLPIVLLVYYFLSTRMQNAWLLVASYVFYGWWDWRFLGLILISTVVDFIVGGRIAKSKRPTVRKRLLIASLATNLGILGVFKYYGFFVQSCGKAGYPTCDLSTYPGSYPGSESDVGGCFETT